MSLLEKLEKYGKYTEISAGEYAGPCPECGGAMRFRVVLAVNEGKCGSCSYVIPGVADEPAGDRAAVSEGSTFDTDKMQQLVTDTYSRVFSQCPKGASAWLEANRPDITQHLVAEGVAVDAAFEAGDEAELLGKLATWEKYHLAAWQRYNERPEVIERQAELFEQTTTAARPEE